ncbi:DsbA family oxidoreductase [Vibrio breoganii]|uniref:DsbA family oxidoreductase n=1 Tax=Vibrio breoganii TaxID=553239 RepID=UPI000C81AE4E|nr:DsbA family oxidoreductase [Vibrio breoganii]PMG86012.1 thioredoxin [Vibrio breoganii]PMI20102.1 thioredoxin [Vibrio breoganii]PML21756.1 thioredoxin [Vibrio breoganii]PMM11319.1 thioredoxin [Vibrio breoganii]PMM47833.1 thioredoxin [Vibrio breoganii]
MSSKIKLDIVSDVVCPWCIIGYNNLQAAINELALQDKIDIEWQPFELNPDMPAEGENLRDHVARKYGSSPEDSAGARERIATAGAEHGFQFNYFDDMKMVNTLEAHVLLDYARQHGKQTELKLRLFNAFFSEQKDVSDRAILKQELTAVGLDGDQGLLWLDKPELKNEVRSQEAQWQQMGITGVPTVIFNRESAVAGAHPVENYKQILLELSKGLE